LHRQVEVAASAAKLLE